MRTILWWVFSTGRKLSVPERVPGTAGEVRFGATSGQDPTGRVRAVRRSRPESAGRGKTRDLHFPGLYPLLWATPQERNLHPIARHHAETTGCENTKHPDLP